MVTESNASNASGLPRQAERNCKCIQRMLPKNKIICFISEKLKLHVAVPQRGGLTSYCFCDFMIAEICCSEINMLLALWQVPSDLELDAITMVTIPVLRENYCYYHKDKGHNK